jgi:hypothetical protein
MSWKDRIAEFGPSNLLFLSTDGASINFIVVDDPVLIKGTYKHKANERVGCPVVTAEGFVLFIVGKRTARKLASLEDKFKDHVINVTRHGVEGDMDATYEVTAIADADGVKKLKAIAAKTYSKESLAEAIADSVDVTNR